METANNRIEISKINSDMISLEKQISDVAEGLKDVVTKSELADMMNSFISDDDEKWLMFNAKFSSADAVSYTHLDVYKRQHVAGLCGCSDHHCTPSHVQKCESGI